MNSAFFDAVRKTVFGGKLTQDQVDGCNVIASAWEKWGDGDRQKLAYLLATAFHETARTMQPIYERGAKSYFNKYEPGTRIGRALGNTVKGDGYLFRGRGYAQLTGRYNYTFASGRLGLPLSTEPDLALKAGTAARILITGCLEGWFTSRKLGRYIADGKADYVEARRVVNGTDRAADIARYAHQFEGALKAAEAVPKPVTPPVPETPASEPRKPGNWVSALVAFLLSILKGLTKWSR